MRPPRALLVPSGLDRLLGAPHDASLQRTVLDALLHCDGPGPLVESFETDAAPSTTDDAEQWVCPVSFPATSTGSDLGDRIVQEVASASLYAMGLTFLRRRKSSFIHGTEDDARTRPQRVAGVRGQLRNTGTRLAGGQ